ncbi:MAG: BFD domain protein (2Fe-2S)-binding protein [uncultured bacterium]|nr:MAG: BFD domain protein (2Fe-2S)-binding protein [uncultured bacterium]
MTGKEKWLSAPPEEIVCYCLGVSKGRIIEAIRSGCRSLKAIKDFTKACTGNECETKNPGRKCCSQDILELIDLYADNAGNSAGAESQCCCKSKK